MAETLSCVKHEEQIKTLYKRVDDMNDFRDVIHNLDKNMAVQTQMMREIFDHNKRQDDRMDKQDKVMSAQQVAITKISESLTELTEGQRTLNSKVDALEDGQEKLSKRVNENEEKSKIDLMLVMKSFALKYILPLGAIYGLIELIKLLKG